MPISNVYIYNFKPDGSSDSGYPAFTAASSSVALPANMETLLLQTTANVHFRVSSGAGTAVLTDPILSPQQGPVIVKLSPSISNYFLSLIADAAGSGNVSYCKVMEG